MILVTVWALFITMTLAGLIVAYNQTRHVLEGYEAQTIIFSSAEITNFYTFPI